MHLLFGNILDQKHAAIDQLQKEQRLSVHLVLVRDLELGGHIVVVFLRALASVQGHANLDVRLHLG